jgi:DNA-binding transcriptional LysR family regulator
MKRISRVLGMAGNPSGISLEHLRLFLAAARSQNFTQAADVSYISQSAFSRQIQNLELALGTQVFERVGRHVQLNDAGRELEKRAAEILARVDRLVADIGPAGQGLRGTIRLGANMSVGIRLLPKWLSAFAHEYEAIHVTLLLRTMAEMAAHLRGEIIDAAIQEEPDAVHLEGKPPMKVHMHYPDQVWVVGPKGVNPATPPPSNARWFGNPDTARRRKFTELGLQIGETTQVPALDVALNFVEEGMGYAAIPGFMAQESWRAGRITRLNYTITRYIAFITLADRDVSPCVKRLIEFLRPLWKSEAERQRALAKKA